MEGGWHEQTKITTLEKVAEYMAAAGVTTFCITVGIDTGVNNRDPEQPPAFPRQIAQVEEATKWVEEHAATYNGSAAGGVHIVGASAGAHIALFAAMQMNKVTAGRVRSAVGLSGPYDLRKVAVEGPPKLFTSLKVAAGITEKELEEYVAGTLAEPKKAAVKAFLETYSVPTLIDKTTNPKLFIAHAEKDGTVFPKETEDLSAALIAAGCTVTTIILSGIGPHGFTMDGSVYEGEKMIQRFTNFVKTA